MSSSALLPVLPDVRTLIVDDTVEIHRDYREILAPRQRYSALADLETELFATPQPAERTKFVIDSAYQSEEAISAVKRAVEEGRPYSLAFIDARMPPGDNGILTLSRLWEIDPNIQAVLCTAYSDHSWDEIVRTVGHSDGLVILRKPFDPIELLQIAHALARKWHLRQELQRHLTDLEALVARRTADLELANAQLRHEIEQRATAETHLKHLATHDALTGLPNRILLREQLDSAMTRSRQRGTSGALMLLDLDGFKGINDTLGHTAGDELLKIVASRLSTSVRSCDVVARLGGDEFVVLLEGLTDPVVASTIANRVVEACRREVEVAGTVVRTPASVGIALFPEHCEDAESLLKSADLAMYQVKAAGGGGHRFYAPEMGTSVDEKHALLGDLELAVSRGELRLHYQPIMHLADGSPSGVEALVRWEHPALGMVPPMRFIPAAESSGLIVPIGTWVLRTACRQLAAWTAAGIEGLTMAVNVSVKQLRMPDFFEIVRTAVADSGIDPTMLELEITESAAMDDAHSLVALRDVAALGVRIAIDDFGSGYSSLVRLKEMPIHTIKIDRFFVKDIAKDPRDAAIVSAIVFMARSLGMEVVAEGVEDLEQLAALRQIRWAGDSTPICHRVQGFFFSRPLAADAATALLEDAKWKVGRQRAA